MERPTLAKQQLGEYICFLRKTYANGQNYAALGAILDGLARDPPTHERDLLDTYYNETLGL